MLTEEDHVETYALARRGWSVSAIARHTCRDRKTVRNYLWRRPAAIALCHAYRHRERQLVTTVGPCRLAAARVHCHGRPVTAAPRSKSASQSEGA
jgi:transposase